MLLVLLLSATATLAASVPPEAGVGKSLCKILGTCEDGDDQDLSRAFPADRETFCQIYPMLCSRPSPRPPTPVTSPNTPSSYKPPTLPSSKPPTSHRPPPSSSKKPPVCPTDSPYPPGCLLSPSSPPLVWPPTPQPTTPDSSQPPSTPYTLPSEVPSPPSTTYPQPPEVPSTTPRPQPPPSSTPHPQPPPSSTPHPQLPPSSTPRPQPPPSTPKPSDCECLCCSQCSSGHPGLQLIINIPQDRQQNITIQSSKNAINVTFDKAKGKV